MQDDNTLPSAPSYSSLPLPNEETVQYTPQPGTGLPPGGTYTKKWKPMTVTLHTQPFDVDHPVYHTRDAVAGELEPKHPEQVLAVSVKLEGRILLSITAIGVLVIRTVDEEVDLWKKGEGGASAGQCPGIFSFSLRLPSSFNENGIFWRLPPSFEASFIGVPTMFVKCTYGLSISLERVVKCGLVSWIKRKTYHLPIDYQPRKRPNFPMPRFDSIFSSIKQIPDEWTQLSSTVGVKPGSVMKPLDCHFILPINSSYSLSDTIPFHIQLLGSIGMLMELLPTSSSLFQPTQDRETIQGGFPIEVKIARQITVDIRGQKSLRTLTIGKGEMWPVPPDIEHVSSVSDDICLDWEGEAKCWKEVSCGGFFIGCVRVRDYIVLALNPPPTKTMQLLPMQIVQPINFVTDPWIEVNTAHGHDY